MVRRSQEACTHVGGANTPPLCPGFRVCETASFLCFDVSCFVWLGFQQWWDMRDVAQIL